MRVLYYHQHFSTPQGASGIRSYQMAQALIKQGHRVTMVCGSCKGGITGLTEPFRRGMREGLVNGIWVIEFELPYSNYDNLWQRSLTFLRFAVRSINVLFQQKYDLIFASSTPLTAGIPGIVGRWFLNKPFVFEVRDLWPELPRAMGVIRHPIIIWLLTILEWITYHSAHHCIGLAPGICKGIRQCGIPPERITLIPNGSDLNLSKPSESVKHPELIPGVKSDQFVAAFTGAHGLANGLDAILDVAVELKHRGRGDICLVLIGDGKCKPKLMRRARETGLNNCLFIEPVPKLQLLNWLSKSVHVGLVVLQDVPAFQYGTSPNKFFDYIACGLPIINNYPGWLADLITEHQCGLAVPPNNPNAFAEALTLLADNPDMRIQNGNNARSLAETHFNRDNLSQQWVQTLEKLI